MAQSIQEINEIITTIFEEYGERQIKRLVNTADLKVEELYELRGKAAACRDLLSSLRNQLDN